MIDVDTDYDAVVYDLDGTLVRLRVDWETVATEVGSVLDAAGFELDGRDLWGMIDLADEEGLLGRVEETIAPHEKAGARASYPVLGADHLTELALPAAVCSLNCEDACRIALREHDLDDRIEAVVGRDSLSTRKPDPEPLLTAIDSLPTSPERTVFVGDSKTDEVTAERAGVPFSYVGDGPTDL